MRLDRLLSNQNHCGRRNATLMVASGRVAVDGQVCLDSRAEISRFRSVMVDGVLLQHGEKAHYLMLNKPAGYLSATSDPIHPTVMELVEPAMRPELHIGGRLDRASTGLLILTNDGLWSRRLTEPAIKIPKVYRVTTAAPISDDTRSRFAGGIHFGYENLTTSPASLEQLAACEARVIIYEGRYHQVKRMFHAVGNRVVSLHRESMGEIRLDENLPPGNWRALTEEEILSVA
ncbi:pseudouridine synthase [Marinobacter sp.]|uniref:pseudouridine synthase n=1 Tax=Marinobacter sp. TaxID=50741 RepID=UPI0038516817